MKTKGVKVEVGLMKKSYCQWDRDWLMTLFVIFYPCHFVRAILSIPFVQCHFVRIPFCPYHFVRTILSATIFVLEPFVQLYTAFQMMH